MKPFVRRIHVAALCALFPLGCVFGHEAPPPSPPPPPPPPAVPQEHDLVSGVNAVLTDLSEQLGPKGTMERTLVFDPMLDGKTGQQTDGSTKVHHTLNQALPGVITQVKLLPFDPTNTAQARLVGTATVTALSDARYRLSVAISDRTSGIVVAQAAVAFKQADLGALPTKFYTDSPSLVRDRSVEGYLRTAETEKGKAADALYIEQVPTASLLTQALDAYNAERWEEALQLYTSAVQRPDGQQLRAFNGLYLANVQLDRMKEAEEAFGKIAALGLATNNLSVKLLFTPGTTEFWADPKVNGVYPMWLRQIARAANQGGSCLTIVGHTSKTGTVEVNDRLSLERAKIIRTRLNQEVPGITNRIGVRGVGSRENLVGVGADDASDALDRRVEFKVTECVTTQ